MSSKSEPTATGSAGKRSTDPTSQAPASGTTAENLNIPPELDESYDNKEDALRKQLMSKDTQYEAPYPLVKRPDYSKLGKPAMVNVNAFKVLSAPTIQVHQFDVSFSTPRPSRQRSNLYAIGPHR